jgi:hypothetical protein
MRWREGLAFACWDSDAIRAHLGRLLAYALPVDAGTAVQRSLIAQPRRLRPLPDAYRGAAPTLARLAGRWAVPGTTYAEAITTIANHIVEDA